MVSLAEEICLIDSEAAKEIGRLAHMGNEMKGIPHLLLIRVLIWYPPSFYKETNKKELLQNIDAKPYI